MSNSSYFSDTKSVRTTGGGLANRLTTALSRVAWNYKSAYFNFFTSDEESKFPEDHDEDLQELQQLIEEYNIIADLTVKYNSQIKIAKIIEANDDYAYGLTTKKKLTRLTEADSKSVSSIM